MSEGSEAFVTIRQAAQRLGITDRHARRLSLRLAKKDIKTDSRPTRVRLEAMKALRSSSDMESAPSPNGTDSGPESGPASVKGSQALAVLWEGRYRESQERIADKEREIERLTVRLERMEEALKREQENHSRTQGLLLALAPAPEPEKANDGPQEAPSAPEKRGLFRRWFGRR